MIWWLFASCWYFGSIHALERAYVNQDFEVLQKQLQHSHQRYMREQSALFLSQIPSETIEEHSKADIIPLLLECVQDEEEFSDVRAACAVTLGNWQVFEAVVPLIKASTQMKTEEDRYWMYYALAKLKSKSAISHLQAQKTTDILLQQSLQDWAKNPNTELDLRPIFQVYFEDER